MYHYLTNNKEEFMRPYHLKSDAESLLNMMKCKQGLLLRTRNDVSQKNEIMCKCLVHNICVLIQEMFELGIRVDFKEILPQEFMRKAERLVQFKYYEKRV